MGIWEAGMAFWVATMGYIEKEKNVLVWVALGRWVVGAGGGAFSYDLHVRTAADAEEDLIPDPLRDGGRGGEGGAETCADCGGGGGEEGPGEVVA